MGPTWPFHSCMGLIICDTQVFRRLTVVNGTLGKRGVTPNVSKNVKFRMSRNSTKLDVVARFHDTIPTVKSVSSSEIYKNFLEFDQNYHFIIF